MIKTLTEIENYSSCKCHFLCCHHQFIISWSVFSCIFVQARMQSLLESLDPREEHCFKLHYRHFNSTKLHHSPDVSTLPGFKLTIFIYILCFSERLYCTSFYPGYVQPSSDMFTYDASPLVVTFLSKPDEQPPRSQTCPKTLSMKNTLAFFPQGQ